ncbi:MAG: hypothetical protein J2P15_13370 [Micromonosporaceae bacterium]|nr:hypothetical protein [Micromonosporaceae bacterium]
MDADARQALNQVDPSTRRRPDSELLDLDIPAAIAAGIAGGKVQHRSMFTDAAIAASLRLEEHGVGPYPVLFLAGYVRSAGRVAALALPQPLVGSEPAELARRWLAASCPADGAPAGDDIDADIMFARWLEMVAALLSLRRSARRSVGQLSP